MDWSLLPTMIVFIGAPIVGLVVVTGLILAAIDEQRQRKYIVSGVKKALEEAEAEIKLREWAKEGQD